jgi:CRISPR-associated endonuclease/helicase Cas3
MPESLKFQFRTFAQKFNLIDDRHQRGIVVWYKNEKTGNGSYELIKSLRKYGPNRRLTRKLQRFVVNVPLHVFNKMRENGYVEEVSGYWVQSSSGIYTPGLGLITDDTQWMGESVI